MEVDKVGQPLRCYNCQKPGHMAKDCRVPKKKETRKCYNCGLEGHLSKNCRKPKKNKIRKVSDEEESGIDETRAEDIDEEEKDFPEGSD